MPIRTAKSGPVAVVTIGAPETRNSLDGRSGRELIAAFDDAAADGGVSALVLRGAGGHFCAGADRALLASARERPQDLEIIASLEAVAAMTLLGEEVSGRRLVAIRLEQIAQFKSLIRASAGSR